MVKFGNRGRARIKPCHSLVFCLLSLILGCLRAPTPPSWDTTINLPLASRKILMRDYCDTTLDSIALFKEGFEIDTILAQLYLDSLVKDTALVLRDISINKGYADTIYYNIGNLFPELIPYHGQVVDVPAKSFSREDTFVFDEDFFALSVDSGYLRVGLYNNTPIRIDSLYWILFTPDIFACWFYNIGSRDSASTQWDISGKTFQNLIPYRIDGWTHDTTSVLIDTSNYVRLVGELFVDKVGSYIGKFPACTSEIDVAMKLAPYKIELAVIDTGWISVSLWNPIYCEFDMELQGTECSFLPFTSHIYEGSNDTTCKVEADTIQPVNPDTLHLSALLATPGGSVIDTVNDADTFWLSVDLRNLALSRFKGYIDTTITIDIPHYGKRIDYGDIDPTHLVLDSVWLYYDIWNGINASPALNLVVSGVRDSVLRELNLTTSLIPGDNYAEIHGDSITGFVNFWPESLDVRGQVSLTGAIDVSSSDQVWGEIGFGVPLDFIIIDTLIIEPDTLISLNIPGDVRERTIYETSLLVWMLNTTEVRGDVSLFLSNNPESMGEPVAVLTLCSGQCEYWCVPALSDLLKSDRLWAKVRVRIYPGDFQILISDRIHIKTLLKIKGKVGL